MATDTRQLIDEIREAEKDFRHKKLNTRLDELHHCSHGKDPMKLVVGAAQRSLEKPRGLYPINEVIEEFTGPDMLLASLAVPYSNKPKYQ